MLFVAHLAFGSILVMIGIELLLAVLLSGHNDTEETRVRSCTLSLVIPPIGFGLLLYGTKLLWLAAKVIFK